jgi:hypothetical protein
MRSLIPLCSLALVACGIFGATDGSHVDEAATNPDASSAEADAALPPVGGPAPPGIYVSASRGRDDGDGSPTAPLKTLTRGLAVAKGIGVPVIACAEEYPEALVLVDGVSAFGFYDCTKTPWERGAPRAVVVAPTSPAVLARGIVAPTRLVGFDIRSPDLDSSPATDGSGTSVALEIRESKGLSVGESLLHAGNGAPGTDGTPGLPNALAVTSDGVDGVAQHERTCPPLMLGGTICSAIRIVGSAGGTTTCTIGPSGGPGGFGGDGRIWINRQMGTNPGEQRGGALVATTSTAVGGLNTDSGGLGIGLKGSAGAAGADGPDGVNGAWSLSSMGFTRGTGTPGAPGAPGQGGGGGGGTGSPYAPGGQISPPAGSMVYATATGGGGGGGGCGGQPGTPGTGGGASIGALVIDSVVAFDHVRIEAGRGGRGGKGNLGTVAVAGGTGGLGTVVGVERTGPGGAGGAGGEGGASGHGAPGPSIALAYSKARPATMATDLVPGPAAEGQPLLTRSTLGGSGMKILPGIAGDSLKEYVIPN